jgi:hypothetical protein
MEINKSVYSALTKNLYRVEFSEAQEQVRKIPIQNHYISLNNTDIIDSEDWFTVFDCVNDLEYKIFQIFVETNYSTPYTLENLLESSLIISRFANKLAYFNYEIVPIKN